MSTTGGTTRAGTHEATTLAQGHAVLGIELGSTRIKAVLVDPDGRPLASGSHDWENQLDAGVWTYSLDAVWAGLQDAYAKLVADAEATHGVRPTTFAAAGISAMMHGYLAFDAADELLVPFRTWRNTTTERASVELTELFGYPIPQRWSIAHLRQAVLDDEPHVGSVAFLTTLAGYVHWRLTGERVLGVGDASGMFPVDPATRGYDTALVESFDTLVADRLPGFALERVLPRVLVAGTDAGRLTAEGAALLDPTGALQAGVPLCPPEGDAGTGMVATNAIAPRTGNVSVGTSIFAMIVLERPLSAAHPEVDLVTTPAGDLVAMVHCNNGASELGAWAGLLGEFAAALGHPSSPDAVFGALLGAAPQGEADGGGLLAYNYLAGEPVTGLAEGRPLVVRTADSRFTLANFSRTLVHGVFGTLALGMRVLDAEGVEVDAMLAHGGLFRTQGVAQRMLAAALDTRVSVGTSAGEGGAWGIAVLAAYLGAAGEQSLGDFLTARVFAGQAVVDVDPDPADVAGFAAYLERYSAGLAVERAAVEAL